jgi:ketosteroid isomerase-like protein
MPENWDRAVKVNDATHAAWNAHDPDAVAAVFAEDAVLRDVGNPDEVRGRQSIRDRAATLLAGFSDFRLERLDLVIDGDHHADRWVATGNNDGEPFGVPVIGRSVRVEGATFTRMGPDGRDRRRARG